MWDKYECEANYGFHWLWSLSIHLYLWRDSNKTFNGTRIAFLVVKRNEKSWKTYSQSNDSYEKCNSWTTLPTVCPLKSRVLNGTKKIITSLRALIIKNSRDYCSDQYLLARIPSDIYRLRPQSNNISQEFLCISETIKYLFAFHLLYIDF